MTYYLLTSKSGNAKTGPIPVSITSSDTCPPTCPLRGAGCYAEIGPLTMHWRRVERGEGRSVNLKSFAQAIASLPLGQLWRHNQAGDLPGDGDSIDANALRTIVDANARAGAKGFTFTHKPVGPGSVITAGNALAIERANANGFTVNMSADSMAEADELASLGIGPVTVVLRSDASDAPTRTPEGRHVIVCPAQTAKGEARGITCKSCQLCAIPSRRSIVGFKAHGRRAKQVNLKVLQ